MRKIEAVIRHSALQEVQDALDRVGVSGLTITEVKGCGRQKGYTEVYRGARANISLLPKVKVETVVPEAFAPEAVEAIRSAAHTGEVGDGRIFVLPVESAIRIRTGEEGVEILESAERAAWGH
ncbi:MAG: P-II family nitrogen regulator [Actinobacteria bacterium]|nr:MAG: P-II family nitrogen regulator [Actinomycetota bacterium]